MISRFMTLVVSAGLLTGCTPILKEVRHPGGYPGYLLDKRTFDASRSKDVQLLRAAIILSMATRMATATVKDGKDGDAFTDYLAAASDELNYTASNIYETPTNVPCKIRDSTNSSIPCASYYALFESDIPLLEGRITRLMLAALPENRAKEFLEDVASGNVLSAAWSALKAISETTGGLHRSTGVYRSGLELLAADVPTCKTGTFNQTEGTVWDAAECLGLSHDDLFENPNELKESGLAIRIKKDAFYAIMLVAQTSCARLPLATGNEPLGDSKTRRNNLCGKVEFKPTPRPRTIE